MQSLITLLITIKKTKYSNQRYNRSQNKNIYIKIIICLKETLFREVDTVRQKTKRFSRPTRLLYTIIK